MLFLSNILVPNRWVRANVVREKPGAFGGVQINHVDAKGAQLVDPTLEVAAFTDDQSAETELSNQTAAIPAGRESRDHNEVAITALTPGIAEGVGFAVDRGIALLHATVVAGTDKLTGGGVEDCGADGDTAFGEARARFLQRNGEHGRVIECAGHGHL